MAGANEAARGGLVIDFVVSSSAEAKVGRPTSGQHKLYRSVKTCASGNVHHLRSYLAKT